MASRESLFLVLPFVPLVVAALTALLVATRVRRDFTLLAAPAAGLAAMCVVVIGVPLLESLHQGPPGAGGPWAGAGGNPERLVLVLAIAYAIVGALVRLVISAVAFAIRRPLP